MDHLTLSMLLIRLQKYFLMKPSTRLGGAWYIIVIDPVWGRQRYLWQQVEKVIRQGAGPFDIRPSPTLALDIDFVY
jgi:hypothetical protein